MRICCVSDLHGNLPLLSLLNELDFDVLVIAGDIVPGYAHNESIAKVWLDTTFRNWLNEIKQPVIGIAGNHDFIFQNCPHWVPKDLPWTYLEDSGTEFEGLKIWGSPHQPIFGGWAFNLTEQELKKKWDLIPDDTDILITHGPPRGYGDWTPYGGRFDSNVGSYTLLNRITQLSKLKLHTYGHIHASYGHEMMGETHMVNASYVGEDYSPRHLPIVIEI